MRAAFFNPDRAVEYLLNGIPESAQREERPAQAQAPASAPQAAGTPAAAPASEDEPMNLFEAAAQAGQGGRGGARGAAPAPAAGLAEAGAGGDALEFLRNNAQFQQLRQIVQAQPQMLEPILQQVAAGNPQIAQLIGQNPEQFMQLLAEDVDDDAALPPGVQQVSVTEEEREAIERVSYASTISAYAFANVVISYAVLVLSEIWSSRPTLLATKTRNWPPTSSSISLMKRTSRISALLATKTSRDRLTTPTSMTQIPTIHTMTTQTFRTR